MRLVSWNVCDAFNRKFGHVERLRPDIAILQEVRPSCIEFAGLSAQSIWIGNEGRKGLAAIAYGDWQIARVPLEVSESWFIPLVATKGPIRIQVVAVLVDSSKACGPPTLRALDQLAAFIRSAPTVLAGDFNNSVSFDPRKGVGTRFSDVLNAMGALGLTSAWHSFSGEAHGEESAATLYWRWNANSKFHIDFVFHPASMAVEHVSIGTYDQCVPTKISDHAPIIVDFAI